MNPSILKLNGKLWAAALVWLLVFLVIDADVLRKPTKHTTSETYRNATHHWWSGVDPYSDDSHGGFLYFPQAAILYTPFALGELDANKKPDALYLIGEILWRVVTFSLFGYSIWRLARVFLARHGNLKPSSILILALLAVPCSMASLRNAQFDLPLAALLVLTFAEIASMRWTAATFWMCLAVALKPLAVVPLLLFGALYFRKLTARITLGLLIVLLVPFLNPHPSWVAHEYVRCGQTLLWAAQSTEPKFSDVVALLNHAAIYPPGLVMTVLRVSFALIFLSLGALAVRRCDQVNAAWCVGALSATYLMLFNPRTETCSYVFLGPFVAALAVVYLHQPGRKVLGYFLCFAALAFASDALPPVHLFTDRWLKALMALIFFPIILRFAWEQSRTPVLQSKA